MAEVELKSNEQKLSTALRIALKDCADYAPHRPYVWKPKSMQKLEALALVAPDTLMYAGQVAYRITDKGRELLTALDVAK